MNIHVTKRNNALPSNRKKTTSVTARPCGISDPQWPKFMTVCDDKWEVLKLKLEENSDLKQPVMNYTDYLKSEMLV
jgi:hypothetical protein